MDLEWIVEESLRLARVLDRAMFRPFPQQLHRRLMLPLLLLRALPVYLILPKEYLQQQ